MANTNVKIPFLAKLGVPAGAELRSPNPNAFPSAFNAQTKRIWDAATAKVQPTKDIEADWAKVIDVYLKDCTAAGQYPFSDMHQSVNDQIMTQLAEARRAVVKFINNSKLLQHVAIRDSHHKVTMTNTGFVLAVHGVARLKDPTFPQWLTKLPMPHFQILKVDSKYIKSLGKGVTMYAYNEGANLVDRWHIGYEINIMHFPDIPNNYVPSKAELERFILDILYMPILKSHRPFGVTHKLL